MEIIGIVQDISLADAIMCWISGAIAIILGIIAFISGKGCNIIYLAGVAFVLMGGLFVGAGFSAVITPCYDITLDVSKATYAEVQECIRGYSSETNKDGSIVITIVGEEDFFRWCYYNDELQPQNFLS